MTDRFWSPLVLVLAASLSTTASAVVPGGKAILRRFAEKQALDRVTASPLVGSIVRPGSAATVPVRVELTLPSTCKAQLETSEGDSTVAYTGGKVSSQGTASPAMEALIALSCPLVATKNVPASDAETSLAKVAAAWGVDLGTTSLGMLEGRAAYVVGARPRELSKPQIWIDKATDRVIRVIGTHGGKLWDLRFDDPASIGTNRLAPRVTQVWQDKRLVLTLNLMAAEPKVTGPAAPAEADDEE